MKNLDALTIGRPLLPLLLAVAAVVSGCATYDYRLVQPPLAQPITEQSVTVQYDPLEYRFSRYHDRLFMRIVNPTDQQVTLSGKRSYVIDPSGETHPLPGRVIAPHSYTSLLLPPEPITAQTVWPYYGWGRGWGWGWGWGPGYYPFGPPYYDGFYGAYYGPPPVTYYQIVTPYNWQWGTGPARLRLSYEAGGKTFEHDLEIVRERTK